ncbi:MAG TPA: serine/threonine protein kinase [Sedimenticola sp.]|nr:serine/threonine protein kinase [Sedimenticola sp.]
MEPTDEASAFSTLGPGEVLDAVESLGYRCDGRLLALNSYENRVYQVGIEGAEPLVGKFYRPGRWTDAAILEEHDFSRELEAQEIPLVAPLDDADGRSLHRHGPFRFALYPRRGGRVPDLEDPQLLEQMGRLVARIHNVGALRPFRQRPALTVEAFGEEAFHYLLEQGFIPPQLQQAYRSLAEDLVARIRGCFARAGAPTSLRLHGDCHPGNILTTGSVLHIVDLDDARMGPAVQDLWMFLSGDRAHMTARLADVLEGYTRFREFDPRELHLLEALRTLRMMHYAAWLARRWDDPAFPRAFPYFNTERYWGEHILSLREQAALMDEPPLTWD